MPRKHIKCSLDAELKNKYARKKIETTAENKAQTKLQQALALHNGGQFAQARELYEEIIHTHPQHADALHLLGVLAAQTNEPEKALTLIKQAITLNPNKAPFYNNLGNTQQQLKQFDAALRSCNQAIAIKPDYAEAHNNRGNALQALEKFDDALASYDQAIALKPDYAEAHNNRGHVLHALQKFDDALASYDKAIRLKPDYAEAHNNRGNTLQALEQFDAALACYDQAIAHKVEYAQAYRNRATILQKLKQLDSALACFNQALALEPNDAKTHNIKGTVLQGLQRFDEALASYSKAIALQKDYVAAINNRGIALHELKQFDAAIASYNEAIALKPDYAEAFNNRGNTFQKCQQLKKAIADYGQAIKLKADYAQAYNNRGTALQELRQFDATIADYDKAIALRPDFAQANFNKSLALLLLGHFEEGWQMYEWRWQHAHENLHETERVFTQPLWLGKESLVNKTILLHSEQGFGDTIQFCRYAKLVADCGARVIFEAPKPLLSLLAGLDSVSEWVAEGEPLPSFDYHCPLLSLPLAFNTKIDTIPFTEKYLHSDQNKIAQWQRILGIKTKPRVGIVWSGSTVHKNDQNRSILLAELAQYLPNQCQYISLQKEIRDDDKKTLKTYPEIRQYCDLISDFSDTAALCELMDIVVSVDTSVAHLACALGKKTWILLPFSPDWRWLLNRTDSPWYISAKLYRQKKANDWRSILENIKIDLANIC